MSPRGARPRVPSGARPWVLLGHPLCLLERGSERKIRYFERPEGLHKIQRTSGRSREAPKGPCSSRRAMEAHLEPHCQVPGSYLDGSLVKVPRNEKLTRNGHGSGLPIRNVRMEMLIPKGDPRVLQMWSKGRPRKCERGVMPGCSKCAPMSCPSSLGSWDSQPHFQGKRAYLFAHDGRGAWYMRTRAHGQEMTPTFRPKLHEEPAEHSQWSRTLEGDMFFPAAQS